MKGFKSMQVQYYITRECVSTMKFTKQTLQIAMSGSKAQKTLKTKEPECPECGEVSTLYISGVESHQYKCHGDNHHEFYKSTEELLSEKEIEDLVLQRVEEIDSLVQLQRLLHNNFEFKVELIADPHDGIMWSDESGETLPLKSWLQIHTTDKAVINEKLSENPHLEYRKDDGMLKVVVMHPKTEVIE